MSLEMKYFVLKPHSNTKNDAYAIASRAAMNAYSQAIRKENPELADSLQKWVLDEAIMAVELHK